MMARDKAESKRHLDLNMHKLTANLNTYCTYLIIQGFVYLDSARH
jgi:hypothetical protein